MVITDLKNMADNHEEPKLFKAFGKAKTKTRSAL
jgi:hypothetical protein